MCVELSLSFQTMDSLCPSGHGGVSYKSEIGTKEEEGSQVVRCRLGDKEREVFGERLFKL